jgi:branched-chain amino acid transport system ATP-binding protein
VLLLDEPYEGLAPVIVDEIEKTLRSSRSRASPRSWSKQNAVRALQLADRAVILDTGRSCFDGTAQEVLDNEEPPCATNTSRSPYLRACQHPCSPR